MSKIRILDDASIRTRLRRMAFEIYENHYGHEQITVIGIDERGGYLAQTLVEHLRQISPLEINLIESELDRAGQPLGIDLHLDDLGELKDQPIVIVDDVLYTGYTLLNVVAILLHAQPASIQTAVLIDRGHRLFPVAADILGLQLATTLHQRVHVEVDLQSQQMEAFLV